MSTSGSLSKNEILDLQHEWQSIWDGLQRPYIMFSSTLDLMNRSLDAKEQVRQQWLWSHCMKHKGTIARMGEIYRLLSLEGFYENGQV